MTGILNLVGFPFLISNLGKTKTQLATSELFQYYVWNMKYLVQVPLNISICSRKLRLTIASTVAFHGIFVNMIAHPSEGPLYK